MRLPLPTRPTLPSRAAEVNDEACQVAGLLARTLGRRLQPLSKQLVAWIAPLTTHRRHRVRVAAVRAL